MQNSPDRSGMAKSFKSFRMLGQGMPCPYSSVWLSYDRYVIFAIRTDSRTECHDEAPDSSLQIK